MFKLTEYAIPDFYGYYPFNSIYLNSNNRVTTTTPSELFSYQVSDGYAYSRDKTFELTMIFLTEEAFSNGMDTLLWLTDSGKEGKLIGNLENREFYLYCTCTGVSSIDFERNGTRKVRATFYAKDQLWIEESTLSLTTPNTYSFYDVRVPTRMNLEFNLTDITYPYVHLWIYNVETKEEKQLDYRIYPPTGSFASYKLWFDSHFIKVVEGTTFDLKKAKFNGYISGEWFPTLLPANKGSAAGSYKFKYRNDKNADGTGAQNTASSLKITFLKMRGLPF